ncbi:DUF3226 domain-containing protein [Geoglobus acetivorans]|uniref:Uncharacterized protein n=1 Tax=Geoglobus acetivorans TaxID=565033 RepID=A0A0A7GBA9_GEOAI|nr:hypothetical protein GACE_0248 [Geoglobus acetivorans]
MARTTILTKPIILLGEGKDEELFLRALIEYMGLDEYIQVLEYGGKNRLHQFMRAFVNTTGFKNVKAIGITRDADDDGFENAFKSVRSALASANLPTPERPFEVAGNKPKVAIMILPDNSSNGKLEDLCLESVKNDPAIECINSFFQCLSENKIEQRDKSKARVHAFLATRYEPDKRLGEAAKAGYWNFGSPAFNELRGFIRLLSESTKTMD